MIVNLEKIRKGTNKYCLTLKPRASSKREKKVVRAIALTTTVHQYVGSGPSFLGDNAEIYLNAVPNPGISKKELDAAFSAYKEPPWNSAYEVQQNIILDRKIDENIEYKKSLRSEAIVKQFGLEKLIPKAIRAKHVCRCGAKYKKKSKLHRHQEYCTLLAEERENFAHFEAVNKLLTPVKKGQDEGASSKAKEKKHVRQSLPDKLKTSKRKGKKASKVSKR